MNCSGSLRDAWAPILAGAVALIGLGAGVASAQATLFEARTGAANPLLGRDAGDRSAPALGDLDGDGDLDLVAGNLGTAFGYYENTATASSPTFVERTGAANPFAGLVAGATANPALGDLDGDGDLDLMAGTSAGSFDYFENTGNAAGPAFVLRVGAANPLNGQDVGSFATAALGDLDGDGDLDLVAGELAGAFAFFENTGSRTAPVFVRRIGAANPLDGFDAGSNSSVSLGDTDGDGDLDLAVGSAAGGFQSLENTGSAGSPRFESRSGLANPFGDLGGGSLTTPRLADLDRDGDLDLVSGGSDGLFGHAENLAGDFILRTGTASPLSGLATGSDATPAFGDLDGDLDGDGDLDFVAGEASGALRYFANTGSAQAPVFVERVGAANPLAGQDVGSASAPALGDLDGDGDLDLVVGESDGVFNFFENTGTPALAAFTARTGALNPWNGQDVGDLSTPALGDLDRDGDLDLVAGELDGSFNFFENTGTATSPAFVARVGSENPLDGLDVGSRSTPTLGDLGGDGDLDVVAGSSAGTFVYYENTTLASAPVLAARLGAANPLDGEDVGSNAAPAFADLDGDGDPDVVAGETSPVLNFFENSLVEAAPAALELLYALNPLDGFVVSGGYSAPALGDLDGDGDLDLVAGEYAGLLRYYENTGGLLAAAYVERFGAGNPLDGLGVGALSTPALADLDADGDIDLVAGDFDGRFHHFENTGNATQPVFLERTGPENPLSGRDVGYLATPALGDLDADGDLDLVAGELDGVFDYYENTGGPTAAIFSVRTGPANPLDGRFTAGWSAPALADLDRDGDLDLFSGENTGQFRYFENTGTPTSPVFVERTGPANPMNEQDLGSRSTPVLGDLDGSGRPDLVTGNQIARFQTFVLPEPAADSLVGPGIALLHVLANLRRSGRRQAARSRTARASTKARPVSAAAAK